MAKKIKNISQLYNAQDKLTGKIDPICFKGFEVDYTGCLDITGDHLLQPCEALRLGEALVAFYTEEREVPEELTKEEQFFNEVKGRKIRWHSWSAESYFIPDKLINDARRVMKGIQYGDGHEAYKTDRYVADGFGKEGWSFYEEEDKDEKN